MSGHRYAAEMLQYAEDAAVMEKPWENWEYRLAGGEWFTQQSHPRWVLGTEYRRRPRTILLVNEHVIAPAKANMTFEKYQKVAGGMDKNFYWPNLREPQKPNSVVDPHTASAEQLFRAGMLHETTSGAEQLAYALLRVTRNAIDKYSAG